MALPMQIEIYNAVIAPGGSLSAGVALGPKTLVGIVMPAAWTAAALTFQASADGGTTWLNLQSQTAEYSVTAAASQFIALDPAPLRGVIEIKVRSGSGSVPVVQTGGATIGLVIRPVN